MQKRSIFHAIALVMGVLVFSPLKSFGEKKLDVNKYNQVFNVLEIREEIDREDLSLLSEMSAEIKSLGDLIEQYQTVNYAQYKDLRLNVWEEMEAKMRQDSLRGSQLYRRILFKLGENADNLFENYKADSIRRVIIDLTESNESDTTNRQIWRLMGELINPYMEYDLTHYEGVAGAFVNRMYNDLLQKSVVKDEIVNEFFQKAIKLGYMQGVYTENIDQIFNDLQDITKSVYPKSSQRLKINDAYYNCCRIHWALMEGNMDNIDYSILDKIESDVDFITIPEERLFVLNSLGMFFNFLGFPFKAKETVEKVDKIMAQDLYSNQYTKAELGEKVSSILAVATDGNGSIYEYANELLSELKSHEASDAGIIYTLNYIAYNLSNDGSNNNVLDLLDLYTRYIVTANTSVEAVLGFINLSQLARTIGRIQEADEYIQQAFAMSETLSEGSFHNAVIEELKGEIARNSRNNNDCLSHYIKAATQYEECRALPDILLGLYCRIIDLSGNVGELAITEEYIHKFYDLSCKSGVYQADLSRVRAAEILFMLPLEKHLDAFMNELRLSLENGDDYSSAMYLKLLGQLYSSHDNLENSIYCYQQAFDHIVSSGIFHEDLDYIVGALMDLLGLKGDLRERNYIINAYIDIAKNDDGRKTSLAYLTNLSNALNLEMINGDYVEAAYITENLKTSFDVLNQRVNGDEISTICAQAKCVLPIIKWVGFLYTTYKDQQNDLHDKMRSLKDYAFELACKYRQRIGEDIEYVNIMLAWVSASSALKDDYSSLKNMLDELETITQNIKDNNTLGLLEGIRVSIAMSYQCIADLKELKGKGYLSQFYDTKRDDKINISYLSNVLFTLMSIEVASGNFDGAENVVKRRFNQVKRYVSEKYGTLTEEQRLGLINNGVATPNDINALLMLNTSVSLRAMAYDASMFYKNLLVEGNNYYRSTVLSSNDSTVVSSYQKLISLREELENLMSQGVYDGANFVNCKSKINELEELIYDGCPDLATMKVKREATWKDVRKKLKDNQAAIEFVACQTDGKNQYGALILRRGFDAPVFVQLFNDDDLLACMGGGEMRERDVKRLYLHGGDRLTKNNKGHLLYDGVWRPLEEYLVGVDRIYFCPVGNLSTIQFAAIEDNDHHKLCEKYDLRLLSTTAQLLDKEKKNDSRRKSAVTLVGDVAYEKGVDAAAAASRNYNWRQLSNSIDEITSVASLCDQSANLAVKDMVKGENATEQWFKTIDGNSPEVLLLSTHGFYYSAKDAGRVDFYVNKGFSSDSIENRAIPPLLRGGLVLTDGNQVWNNREIRPDDVDGILTSAEIAKMDMRNTDLVVLSACQTGLGDPTLTEGVNGLQRGFKLAGVKSVIMSLWEVNDMVGTKFMKEFFRQLSEGVEKHSAFRSTQLKLMEEYPTNPFLWAPFVLLD